MYKLINKGPVYINICSTTLGGKGRTVNPALIESKLDDVNGSVTNHSVVIYGNDKAGNFLVADPWVGRIVVDPETMVIVVTAAQIECDNMCFVITGKPK